jgi:ferric-dicitrate binding protein FerR (iron transport regulator)
MNRDMDPLRTAGSRTHPLRRIVLTGVPLAAMFHPVAHGEATTAGHVQEVKGQVTAELASQTRVLVPRADVFNGDDVATAESSRAAMLLGRDTTLRLGANARVRIDRFIVNAGGVLTLESGPLLLEKAPGNPAAAVTVRGSFGLITVRGTRIFVGPSQGVIGIFVVHGLIDVAAGGREFVLQTGEGTNIAGPGAIPTPPAVWGEARVRAALASVD